MNTFRSLAQYEELYTQNSMRMGRDGIVNNPAARHALLTRGVINSKEKLNKFLQRSGLSLIPRSNVGSLAPFQTESVRMKEVAAVRYASSLAFDAQALVNDPKGYCADMGELHQIAASETMNYIVEVALLAGFSTILSGADGLSIFNASHDAGVAGTQSNRDAAAITAAKTMSALSALSSQMNTRGMPLAGSMPSVHLAVNSKKEAEVTVMLASEYIPGSANNDKFAAAAKHVTKVIPCPFWQHAGAGADDRWIMLPESKDDNPYFILVTQSPKVVKVPEARDGIECTVMKFEAVVEALHHFRVFGGGA